MGEPRVRSAALNRNTNETNIVLAINLDGGAFPKDTDAKLLGGLEGHATQSSKSQTISINSGIGFLDHMLHALAKHAGWSLSLICDGDLHSMFSYLLVGSLKPKLDILLIAILQNSRRPPHSRRRLSSPRKRVQHRSRHSHRSCKIRIRLRSSRRSPLARGSRSLESTICSCRIRSEEGEDWRSELRDDSSLYAEFCAECEGDDAC